MNRTFSDQTIKWMKITLLHIQSDLTLFRLHEPNPLKSSTDKYQLILACKEHSVSSYFKFNWGKIYNYKNTCLTIQNII